MLNLLRMNLFRMVHTRSIIVIFALMMGFAVCNACMSAVESQEAMEWYKKDAQGMESGDAGSDMAGDGADMQEIGYTAGDGSKADTQEAGAGNAVDMQGADGSGSKSDMQGAGIDADDMAGDGSKPVQEEDEEIQGIGEDIKGDNVVYNIGYEMGQKGGNMGVYLETLLYPDGRIQEYLMLYGAELSSGILLLFLLIASIIFFWGDEKNGFVKNIAGQTRHKGEIFLSKLIAIGIFTLASMICYMLVEFASFRCSWLLGVDISFGMEHFKEACKVFATQYLLYMAYISGLLLLTEVTRGIAVSITIGLLGILGFGIIFSAMVQKIFHTDFQMVKYFVNTSISDVNMYVGWDVFRLALWVGGIFLVVYNALHMCWFVKKDIV